MTARRLVPDLILLVLVLVGAALFADARKLGEALVAFPWWRMAPALGLALFNYVLRAMRFDVYLRALGVFVPREESARVFVAGFVFSITPGKLGEVFKAWILKERRGVPATETTMVVIAERFTDVLGLLVLSAIGVAQHGTGALLFGSVIGLAVVFLLLVAHPTLLPRAARRLGRLAAGRPRVVAVLGTVERAHLALRTLCTPRLLVGAVIISSVAWLSECIAFRVILDGFPGASGGLADAVLIYAMSTLFGAVSMLPGGMGSTEALMVALTFEAFSLTESAADATAATLLVRFATLWFAVALGAVALWSLRRGRPGATGRA